MAAKKTEKTQAYALDRFGHRHDVDEQDIAEEPTPALPGHPVE